MQLKFVLLLLGLVALAAAVPTPAASEEEAAPEAPEVPKPEELGDQEALPEEEQQPEEDSLADPELEDTDDETDEDVSESNEDIDVTLETPAKKPKGKKPKLPPCYVFKPVCKVIRGCKKCIYRRVFMHPLYCYVRHLRCIFGCHHHFKVLKKRCMKIRLRLRRIRCLRRLPRNVAKTCKKWCLGA